MRARLTKDLRELVPLWAAALMVIGLSSFVGSAVDREARSAFSAHLPELLVEIAVAAQFLLAARLFGVEFDLGTMPRLLAEPLSRARIWREKMLVLVLLTSVTGVALLVARPSVLHAALVGLVLAVAGGPLFALILRQTLAAFWAALSAPMCILFAWNLLLRVLVGAEWAERFLANVPILLPYALVAYGLGRRSFLSLELAGPRVSGRDVPAWFPRGLLSGSPLFGKELRIQTSVLLLVPAVLGVWALGFGLSHAEGLFYRLTLLDSLRLLRAMPPAFFVFLIPLLSGTMAIAYERQIGVTDWHLSLPVSRRRQWGVKVLLGLTLALVLAVLGSWSLDPWLLRAESAPKNVVSTLLRSVGLSLFSLAIGLYASSRARDSFRAAVGAVGLVALTLLVMCVSFYLRILRWGGKGLSSIVLPHAPAETLFVLISVASLALLLLALAGFRHEPWHWAGLAGRRWQLLLVGGLILALACW